MSHGGRRPGAGRKPGSMNRCTREALARAEATGITPLEYMLQVMRDPETPIPRRDDMAKAAAPYLHPRLNAMSVKAGVDLKELSDEQLELARRLLASLGSVQMPA